MMGGTLGDTIFYAMDIDSSGNIVVGGSSQDSGILSLRVTWPEPLVMFIHSGNLYLWAKAVYHNNWDYNYV